MSTTAHDERLEIAIDGRLHATLTRLFEKHFRLVRLRIRRDSATAYAALEGQAVRGGVVLDRSRKAFDDWAGKSFGTDSERYIGSYEKFSWAQRKVKESVFFSSSIPSGVLDWLEAVAELPQSDLLESFLDWEKTLPKVLVSSDATGTRGIEGSPSWSATKIGPEPKWQLQFESGKLQQLVTDCCAATKSFADEWKRSREPFTEETGLKDFSVDDLVPALESLLNKYQSACSQRAPLPEDKASSSRESASSQGSVTVTGGPTLDQMSGSTTNASHQVESGKESTVPTLETIVFSSIQ
ncbi:hypothetical protein NliqN6_2995 [Naganishia liquefaciens]|uniref:Uncharacterized protein n=1 Tax=Naganishia liquefaciens TaxID=104408 RepID=A0A8H3TT29_9TREE|nr:hypothetical protein NliqN6_2995 [Naganishia liquefaciens]